MKKNPQTKVRQKRVLACVKNEITPKTKGMGTYRITILVLFTPAVECSFCKASHGNKRTFQIRKSRE